uniref:Zinc finger protein 467 n=1 Tax=Ascaris suum TaxID=6253 RepID=F1L1J4_ASCSU
MHASIYSSIIAKDIFVEFEKNMTDIEEITKLVSEMLNTVDSNMTVMRNEDEDFLATSRVYSDLLPLATPLVGPSAGQDGLWPSTTRTQRYMLGAETVVGADGKRGRRQSTDDVTARKGEHRRWRQLIDGFAQYAEWEAKVREREKAEDMPDVDGGSEGGTTLSQTTEDPEADYFFRTDLYDFPYKEFLAKISSESNEEELKKADEKFEFVQRQFEDRKKRLEEEKKRNATTNLPKKKYEMFVCFVCGRAFDEELAMREHINEDHFDRQDYEYKCKHCYRRFKMKQHWKRHQRTHDPNSKFQCDRCSASYSLMSSLTVHRSRVHKIGEDGQPLTSNEYECERCGELFGTSVELSRHRQYCLKTEHIKKQRLEKKLKEQASSVADANVDTVNAMAFRPKVDTSCPLCKDNFASYQSMIRHVGRKHPTEDISNIQKKFVACSTPYYPFACIECNKRFATKASLSLHKKRHTNDCPFECEQCGRRYPIASELRKHLITHARKEGGKRSKRQLRDKSTSDDEGEQEEEQGGRGSDGKGSSTKKPKIEYEDLSTFDVL